MQCVCNRIGPIRVTAFAFISMAARGRISDREHTRSRSLNIENKQKQITGERRAGGQGGGDYWNSGKRSEVSYGSLAGSPRNPREKLNTTRIIPETRNPRGSRVFNDSQPVLRPVHQSRDESLL